MKLVHGEGSPTKGACWMSAIKWYAHPESAWGDNPECVDPVIRTLCIRVNDSTPVAEMEAFIGPHLFAPLGTNTGRETMLKRAYRCADFAVREIAPIALRRAGLADHAEKLENLPPIVNEESAKWAARAAREAGGWAAARAAAAAKWAARAAREAGVWAARAAAAEAAAAAAKAAKFSPREAVLGLILELCEMGREDINTPRTKETTLACLAAGNFED